MKRAPAILVSCLFLGALCALPGTASAASGAPAVKSAGGLAGSLAVGACADERRKLGRRSFVKRYGAGKRANRACAKRTRKQARNAITAATAECQAELADYGEEDFYLDWTTFSGCVADYAAWIMGGGGFDEDDPEDECDVEEECVVEDEFRLRFRL